MQEYQNGNIYRKLKSPIFVILSRPSIQYMHTKAATADLDASTVYLIDRKLAHHACVADARGIS
jgi:hypothetical protein